MYQAHVLLRSDLHKNVIKSKVLVASFDVATAVFMGHCRSYNLTKGFRFWLLMTAHKYSYNRRSLDMKLSPALRPFNPLNCAAGKRSWLFNSLRKTRYYNYIVTWELAIFGKDAENPSILQYTGCIFICLDFC